MIRTTLILPLALVAACSQDPVRDDIAQNNTQEVTPPSLPDPVASSPAPAIEGTIPAAFHGRWSASAADCDKEGDVTRLTIAPRELRYYESSAAVTAVSGTDQAITVAARYTGEGETWDATRSLALSDDGSSLTVDGMPRVRCP